MTLRIADLRHTYPAITPRSSQRTVLDIPAWRLDAGAQVVLRGVSGAGKTTFLNILAGLLRPTTGSVEVDGQSLYALPEAARDRYRARHIGIIFQMHHLLPLIALENVEMPLGFLGENGRTRRTRALTLLERVGMADFARFMPRQLSVGQRLRVAVARALVAGPRILLADEPTAALDPESAAQTMDLIQAVCAEQNTILLCASHDPALSARFRDQWALRVGNLVQIESVPSTAPIPDPIQDYA